nr:hypothetical protein [Cytobacillus oceanisediminis]
MFYSVPYEYINRQMDVKLSDDMVAVYFNISTVREPVREHMPDNHKQFLDQTPEVAVGWAESIGSSTLKVVQYLLDSYQSEKQALQSIFFPEEDGTSLYQTRNRIGM